MLSLQKTEPFGLSINTRYIQDKAEVINYGATSHKVPSVSVVVVI